MTSAATSVPPVGTPIYGCGFMLAVKRFFQGYVKFEGKASRSEFWWAFLAIAILSIIPTIISVVMVSAATASIMSSAMSTSMTTAGPAGMMGGLFASYIPLMIFGLAVLLPTLAVMARRLRDAGFTPWIAALQFVGLGIVPLIMCALETKNGPAIAEPGYPQQ